MTQAYSDPASAPFNDQAVALIPDAVGQPGHQRVDWCEDAAFGHVCAYVTFDRAAIDENRYLGWWE